MSLYQILINNTNEAITDCGEDIAFDPSDELLDVIWQEIYKDDPEDMGLYEAVTQNNDFMHILIPFAVSESLSDARAFHYHLIEQLRSYARRLALEWEGDVIQHYRESLVPDREEV